MRIELWTLWMERWTQAQWFIVGLGFFVCWYAYQMNGALGYMMEAQKQQRQVLGQGHALWEEEAELQVATPVPLPVKNEAAVVVGVGIFGNAQTFEADRVVRDAFRASLESSKTQGWVRHWFVFGRGGASAGVFQEENAKFGDLWEGSFGENMNGGKTLEWWRMAAGESVDFVIKMDQDTVVQWANLKLLTRFTPPVYFGTRMIEWGLDLTVSPISGAPAPSNTCQDFRGDCWFYMSGGFYGFSMDLVRALAKCDFARQHSHGTEDALAGFWLRECFPSVKAIDLPFGLVHYHYYRDSQRSAVANAERIRMQSGMPSLQFLPSKAPTTTTVVSVRLMGGLGNQLFQAASSYGLAVSRGSQWCIVNLEGSVLAQSVDFPHVQPISGCVTEGVYEVNERGDFLHYQQWMHLREMHHSVHIVGSYLQSYRSGGDDGFF
jgi:hypothetical protein